MERATRSKLPNSKTQGKGAARERQSALEAVRHSAQSSAQWLEAAKARPSVHWPVEERAPRLPDSPARKILCCPRKPGCTLSWCSRFQFSRAARHRPLRLAADRDAIAQRHDHRENVRRTIHDAVEFQDATRIVVLGFLCDAARP